MNFNETHTKEKSWLNKMGYTPTRHQTALFFLILRSLFFFDLPGSVGGKIAVSVRGLCVGKNRGF